MKELIKITQNENGQVVNARDLYKFLEYNTSHWKRWYERNILKDIFFIENKDYVKLARRENGNDIIDFALTINMAKELSMLSRTPKGKEAREYFIECESLVKSISKPVALPQTYLEALKELVVKEETILQLEEKNEKLQYRSDFVDVCFDTDGVFSMEETCKILKLSYGRNTMLQKLRDLKVFLKSNTPTQKFISNGYFKVVENIIENGEFKKLVSTTYATQKGIGYIHKLLNTKN